MTAPDFSPSALRGALFALVAFGLFAIHDAIVKYLGASYASFQIVFFSVLFSFPLATMMLVGDSTVGNLRPRRPGWIALRTLATVITGLSAFTAFSILPLTQAYAILFSMPLIITVLAIPILGERVGVRRWAAVMVGLVGVLVVLRPGAEPLGLGHFAAITAAFSGSAASVIVRKVGSEERTAVLVLYPLLANFVVMGAAMPVFYRPVETLDLGLLATVAACAFVASLCIIEAYRRAPAVIVAPMQYSQMVWATVLGAIFFGERPDVGTGIGAAIIIASGLYIVVRESGSRASDNLPVLGTRARVETGTYPRIRPLSGLPGRSRVRR